MLTYTDALTGDDMFSEAWPTTLIENVVYEVKATMVNVSNDVNVDTGANASAEGGDEDDGPGDSSAKQVPDLVNAQGLTTAENFITDKSVYMDMLKAYMKTIKNKLKEAGAPAEEISEFETGAKTYLKTKLNPILKSARADDYWMGSSQDPEGMIVVSHWGEDGNTPTFLFWKHGLKATKN